MSNSSLNSRRLHSRTHGRGQPLVMLHGLFGSLENLGALMRPLAQHYAVHALDLPNHGRSPWTESSDLPAMAAAVLEWLSEQGLEQVHLLGHSLGGKVAMELALQYPQRVQQLVVIDIAPVHYGPHHQQVFAGLQALQPEALQSRTDADRQLQEYVPETAVRSFLLKNLVKQAQKGYAWRMNLAALRRDYDKLVAGNSRGQFRGRTLFIKGGDSDYIQEKHREEILSRFPEAELKLVASAGHWVHAEKPELVARLVERFLDAGGG